MGAFLIPSFATHIVGGELNYKCLGNDRYEISLTVRRDCNLGQAAFDDPASIGVFDGNGVLQTTLFLGGQILIPFNQSDTINEILVSDCAVFIGDVCVHTTTYKDTVTLPFIPTGYLLAYQRCCRNSTVLNITEPLETGMTLTARVTENALTGCNNSAVFNQFTPIYVCANDTIRFDHSATDMDGDSLVYKLCSPLKGGDSSRFGSQPQPPSAPPYDTVDYATNYGIRNLLGGMDSLRINPSTGLLEGTPGIVGQFVVGVCIDEYRDGVLISTTRRDFQYNVRNCIDLPQASAAASATLNCEDLSVSFTNASTNAPNYRWYFNYPADTVGAPGSLEENPTFVYDTAGFYTVALVALFDTTCADTAFFDIGVFDSEVEADFNLSVNSCTEEIEMRFTDISMDPDPNFDLVSWRWNLVGEFDTLTSNSRNPQFMVDSSQTFQVNLLVTSANGCVDSMVRDVDVNIINIELVGTDTTICRGDEIRIGVNPVQGFTYTWSPALGLDNPNSANPEASPEDSTIYTVVVQDNFCSVTKSIAVNIAPPIPIENPGNFIACVGDTIAIPVVNGDPNNRFIWIPNDVIVGSNTVSNPLVTSDVPMDVSLAFIGVDRFGCSTTDTIDVSFEGITDFALSDSTITCGGMTAELNPNANQAYEYAWSPAEFLNDSTLANPIANVLTTTVFSVTVTNPDLPTCTFTDDIKVFIPNLFDIDAGEDEILCDFISYDLEASANQDGLTFEWFDESMTMVGSGQQITIAPDETQTYTVIAANEFGCKQQDLVTLTVPSPYLLKLTEDSVLCAIDTVTLTAQASVPNATYVWTDANSTVLGDQASIEIAPTVTGTYFVTASDEFGCTESDSLEIIVPAAFGLNLGGDQILCEVEEITLFANGTLDELTYEWFDDSGTLVNTGDSYTFLAEVTTNLTVVASNEFECTQQDDITIIVSLFDPSISIVAERDSILLGENVRLEATEGDGYTYQWTGPFLSQTDVFDPLVSPVENAEYMVVVTDEFGCSETAIYFITVLNPDCNETDVFLPNAFSPNGDGINDILYVRSNFVDDLDLLIFNRWGEQVFEVSNVPADDPTLGWNGVFKGEELRPDVYGYYLRATCINGKEFITKGNITLLK